MTKMMAGSTAPDAYCDMRPPESEIKSVQSALAASSVVKGLRANICHVSTKSSLALIESARAKGVEVMCEATLHHLFFTRKAMLDNGLLRTNPPLREEEDRASILDGLAAGRVNLLVTDHAPHTRVEKVTEGLAGVPGLDDYSHVVTWLIKTRGIDPVTLGRACSSTPAYFFELEDRGIIASGKRGDLSIVDLRTPQRVTPDSLKTKCGWSPYEGFEFPGGCRWTICGGKVLLDDFEVL
jgi:dihydroorotase